MTKYNYMEAVKEDVKNYIDSEINFESIDVSIRCYLLGSAISEVLDDLEEDFDEAHKKMEV